jgi:hypothetical protein
MAATSLRRNPLFVDLDSQIVAAFFAFCGSCSTKGVVVTKTETKKPLLRRRERLGLLAIAYLLTYILTLTSYTGMNTLFVFVAYVQLAIVVWFVLELITGCVKRSKYKKEQLSKSGGVAEKAHWYERRGIRIVILLVVTQTSRLLEENPEFNPFGVLVLYINLIANLWLLYELVMGAAGLISRLFKRLKRTKTPKPVEGSKTREVIKGSKRKEK